MTKEELFVMICTSIAMLKDRKGDELVGLMISIDMLTTQFCVTAGLDLATVKSLANDPVKVEVLMTKKLASQVSEAVQRKNARMN